MHACWQGLGALGHVLLLGAFKLTVETRSWAGGAWWGCVDAEISDGLQQHSPAPWAAARKNNWVGGGGGGLKVANYPLMRMREVQTKLRALSAGPI